MGFDFHAGGQFGKGKEGGGELSLSHRIQGLTGRRKVPSAVSCPGVSLRSDATRLCYARLMDISVFEVRLILLVPRIGRSRHPRAAFSGVG
jgi:hypothetical protein